MKSVLRSCKNFTKGYSSIQVKLRDATAIGSYGPTMAQLEELGNATHHPTTFADMVYVLEKRLNDHGKYWKHVYKALVVLQHFIVCGAECCEGYARDNINTIRTLNQFQYIDDHGRDQGMQVREKAKEIVQLLSNEALLAEAKRIKALPRGLRSASTEPVIYHDRKELEGRRVNSDGRLTGSNGRSGEMVIPDGYDEEAALRRAIEESRKGAAVRTATTDLLSLDDNTFVNALDGVVKKPAALPQASSFPQISSWSVSGGGSRNAGAITTVNNSDPFAGGQDYGGGMDRAKHLAASSPRLASDKDPFADVTETFKESLSLSRASSGTRRSPMEERVPMPLPLGQTLSSNEIQTGAKPVTPGSFAPQFGYKDRSNTQQTTSTSTPLASTQNGKLGGSQLSPADPFAD